MMFDLDNIRTKANGIWALYLEQNGKKIETNRFKCDAIIIQRKLSNRDENGLAAMLPQMKRFHLKIYLFF